MRPWRRGRRRPVHCSSTAAGRAGTPTHMDQLSGPAPWPLCQAPLRTARGPACPTRIGRGRHGPVVHGPAAQGLLRTHGAQRLRTNGLDPGPGLASRWIGTGRTRGRAVRVRAEPPASAARSPVPWIPGPGPGRPGPDWPGPSSPRPTGAEPCRTDSYGYRTIRLMPKRLWMRGKEEWSDAGLARGATQRFARGATSMRKRWDAPALSDEIDSATDNGSDAIGACPRFPSYECMVHSAQR